jgi:hypothetical protein
VKGMTGAICAIVFPTLETIGSTLQVMGSGGGLLLLALSVYHKSLQIKKMKKDDRTTDNSAE